MGTPAREERVCGDVWVLGVALWVINILKILNRPV